MSKEPIWFSGYVIDKKTAKPYAPTTNVYVTVLDNKGAVLLTNLYYCENSLFSGNITLPDNIKSGRYYLRAYTNYMNNFSEDESALHEISVININDSTYPDYESINYNQLYTSLYPEGGIFLEGVSNTIAAKITDCNGNGVAITNITVKDAQGKVVSSFSTNNHGYGRFDILQTKNEIYTVTFDRNDRQWSQNLPSPLLTGVTMSVNNYTYPDKTIVQLKTNDRTLKSLVDQQFKLVFQQNDVASFVDVSFANGNTQQLIPVSNEYISDGVNSVFLVDNDLNKKADRVIFKPWTITADSQIAVQSIRTDSITFRGSIPLVFGSLSISTRPVSTAKHPRSIYASLYLDNYLEKPVVDPTYYLSDINRKKHFELDNVLITQPPKYKWEAIMQSPPQAKFTFDGGLTIKGTIANDVGDKNLKVRMSAPVLGIDETVAVKGKEFLFENVMAVDSTTIFFSLLNQKSNTLKLKMYPQILNNRRVFNKGVVAPTLECSAEFLSSKPVEIPEILGAIALADVKVESSAKPAKDKMIHEYRFFNNMARGYKIDESKIAMYRDVLQFIAAHGYIVNVTGGNVTITRMGGGSFTGDNALLVYVDDAPVADASLLLNMQLDFVEEIYIHRRGYGSGSAGPNGSIRIYTKKTLNNAIGVRIDSQSLTVKDGYQPYRQYKNLLYTNTASQAFKMYGTIDWDANVGTGENGMFHFSIPNMGQNEVMVTIEGINAEGQLYSDTQTISVK